MTATARELKEHGQQASLFATSDQTRLDFENILAHAPLQFSINDIRCVLDLAQIPVSARGGLFARAVTAGLITPLIVGGYAAREPSTGTSAHLATVKIYTRTNYGSKRVA